MQADKPCSSDSICFADVFKGNNPITTSLRVNQGCVTTSHLQKVKHAIIIEEFLQLSGSHRQQQEGQCTDQQTLSILTLTQAMKLNCNAWGRNCLRQSKFQTRLLKRILTAGTPRHSVALSCLILISAGL